MDTYRNNIEREIAYEKAIKEKAKASKKPSYRTQMQSEKMFTRFAAYGQCQAADRNGC
jgi:hypothetical protein